MHKHLFAHIDIDPKNVHILDGNAENLEAECEKYEEEIRKVGGIELFLGGTNSRNLQMRTTNSKALVQTDTSHSMNLEAVSLLVLASRLWYPSLCSRTNSDPKAYDTIIANSRFFNNDISLVPKMALTVGVGTVMDAREVIIVITGAHKALALANCIEQGVNHMYTVSAIQMHPHPMIVCDDDATLELKVKTVKVRICIVRRC